MPSAYPARPSWASASLLSAAAHALVGLAVLWGWSSPRTAPEEPAVPTMAVLLEPPPAPPAPAPLSLPEPAHAIAAVPPRAVQPRPVARPIPPARVAQRAPSPLVASAEGEGASTASVSGEGEAGHSGFPAPQAGAGAGIPVGTGSGAAMGDWLAALRDRIQGHLVFPERARKLRLVGRSRVRLRVLSDGSLDETALSVVTGSGFAILDNGALASVRAAAPFPPPPGGTADIEVPVAFNLLQQ